MYRDLFKSHIKVGQLKQIRYAVNKSLALSNERFKDELETLHGRSVKPGRIGRPKKSLIWHHLSVASTAGYGYLKGCWYWGR